MTAGKVAIISNSLSSTMVFRQSLVRKLSEMDRLGFIISTRNDQENIEQDGNNYDIFLLTGDGLREKCKAFRKAVIQSKKNKVTVFHGFTHLGNLVATLLWLFVGGRLVLNITGMGRAFGSTGAKYAVYRLLILSFYASSQFFTNRLIVQNNDDFALLSRLFFPMFRDRISLTYGSGIDTCHFDSVTPDANLQTSSKTRVGFFSRALPEKGVDSFYDLAKRYSSNKNLEFHHWGHAGEGKYSEAQIGFTAHYSNVSYHGFVVDPRPNILAIDIIILPSGYREGLSRLCIEASLGSGALIGGLVIVALALALSGDDDDDSTSGTNEPVAQ